MALWIGHANGPNFGLGYLQVHGVMIGDGGFYVSNNRRRFGTSYFFDFRGDAVPKGVKVVGRERGDAAEASAPPGPPVPETDRAWYIAPDEYLQVEHPFGASPTPSSLPCF